MTVSFIWILFSQLGKKGSFLTRSKDALVKIAQVAKGAFGAKSTGKSKAFVFQTVGDEDQGENKDSVHVQPLKNNVIILIFMYHMVFQ